MVSQADGNMNWHEIVNHRVGGRKVRVTYCPLTPSGINFAAADVAFGNTGGLYTSNMVMYDQDTGSFWDRCGRQYPRRPNR